jgi:hypothetical protein
VGAAQPHQAVPLTPRPADPALQHAGNPAGEFKAVADDPPAVIGRQRKHHVEIYPYRASADRLTPGDALTAIGADPSERHALLPDRLVSRFSATRSSAGERAYANQYLPPKPAARLRGDAGQAGGTNEAGVGSQLGDA